VGFGVMGERASHAARLQEFTERSQRIEIARTERFGQIANDFAQRLGAAQLARFAPVGSRGELLRIDG